MAGLFRLSRKFHETFGDDLAGEIEGGFERVDALNSTALRELFEVRLDQRFSEFRVQIDRQFVEFRSDFDRRLVELKAELRQEVAGVRQELAEFRGEIRGELKAGLATIEARVVRWVFLFWLGTIGISILQK
ncbi:MAG: hypothetical protein HY700_20015 [Gemmatimonadetes bacterium]|nr:hypothetical protein [Gemmatimonadota bacterium]